ncbi:MaoC family dehydratase N-terminal domain-containing protein [Gordonia sp. HY285]|uniref:MaoC family dehydratase N-terminal domain-containing protein n=1 Tax=Gordonia liuliyuniae TaxID=2911517 RepID=A0ABS9ITG1_9ACTN|nr:MaoC family dehydratase N-terminal domain-containing protein [Gordonia liuliyuniae]MCF8588849.1 MaoC family dehydratase N-terminal domain-containing protein [Gordonia liuliyuniae]MCF8609273.1 MaoC family dehydratase N-terminal domain-containing protein [Gordonia liuliyuniae]
MISDPLTSVTAIIERGHERVSVARDTVNRPMIHHLCEALGDTDARCFDPDVARAAGYSDVIAPVSALQVWNMTNPSEPEIRTDVEDAYSAVSDAGYSAVVAVNSDQEYDRALVPGDLLTAHERVESIVGPKTTGLGEGYFITTLVTYTDQNDVRVGTMRFRTLWYDPSKRDTADRKEER